MNVAIIGNGNLAEALPVSEILFGYGENLPKIVSYEAKWLADSELYKKTTGACPAILPHEVEERVKSLAVQAYNITGCRDYARVDFRLRDNAPFLLEVNPNPDINTDSGFFRSARAVGMSYDALIHRILSEALKRHRIEVVRSDKNKNEMYATQRLIARRATLENTDTLVTWFNDPEISKFMDEPGQVFTREKIIEKFFVSYQDDTNLIVSEKEDNREIGFCSIYRLNRFNQSAEISFLIGEKQCQGKGYGTEMMGLLLMLAFNVMKLNSIFATVTQKNIPSMRIFERAGFRKIGVRRQYHFVDGEKMEEVFFEMTSDDYALINAPDGIAK